MVYCRYSESGRSFNAGANLRSITLSLPLSFTHPPTYSYLPSHKPLSLSLDSQRLPHLLYQSISPSTYLFSGSVPSTNQSPQSHQSSWQATYTLFNCPEIAKLSSAMQLLSAVTLLSSFTTTYAATVADWRTRSIYQLITDRFALADGSAPSCNVGERLYCGGTWQGVQNKLSYIQDLGFDSIWM